MIGIILDHIEYLEAALAALDEQIDAAMDEPASTDSEAVAPFGPRP